MVIDLDEVRRDTDKILEQCGKDPLFEDEAQQLGDIFHAVYDRLVHNAHAGQTLYVDDADAVRAAVIAIHRMGERWMHVHFPAESEPPAAIH